MGARRIGVWLFRVVMAVFWLAVGLLGAEVGLRAWDAYEVSRNPYIASREGHGWWPKHEAGSSDLVDQVAPASLLRLPVPTHEEKALAHAPYVLHLDTAFRAQYGKHMDRLTLWLPRTSSLETPTIERWYPESWIYREQVEQLLEAERPEGATLEFLRRRLTPSRPVRRVPLGQEQGEFYEGTLVRVEEGDTDVLFLQRPITGAQPDTTWERPFLSYQPHAEQSGQTAVYGEVPHFRLNNFGFRDDDVRVPKPEGVVRIVCIGASTTEEGPSNGFTYPNLVERFLVERFGEGRVEVINAGVAGSRTSAERARFPDYLMMDPDLIVFYNGVNDICHHILPLWAKNIEPRHAMLSNSRLLRALGVASYLPGEEEIRHALHAAPYTHIRGMAQYARKLGVDTAVCSFAHPDWDALDADERRYYSEYSTREWTGTYYTFRDYLTMIETWNTMVPELCEEEDLMYIPLAEAITGGAETFGDICHMRDSGIERKARAVAEALEAYVAEKLGDGA